MRRSVFDFQDETLFFKSLLPIKTMVGFGMVLGSVPSLIVSSFLLKSVSHMVINNSTLQSNRTTITSTAIVPLLLGSAMMVHGTFYNILYKAITGKSRDLLSQRVVRGRQTALRGEKEDFVVFHLGARPNNNVDSFFQWMGSAFDAILKELEEHPEYGCLGSEMYVGATGTLIIQYWTSTDALNAYARNSANQHASPWAKLMAKGRSSPDYGFWHETFQVKAGKYETIYVNMPPILLGNAHGTKLAPAQGRYVSAAGRTGATDGSDYPKDLGKPDY